MWGLKMLELYQGALPTAELYGKYEKIAEENNCGACCVFCGVVRSENNIQGLSFDIYEPILKQWFQKWQEKLAKENALLCMAHSIGDVMISESSFMCAIISPQRKVALHYYHLFVEDFKHNAPIWKYDIVDSKRIYAKERSHKLPQSGILA